MTNQIVKNEKLTTYEDLSPGQTARFTKTVTEADISHFIAITGDVNPLHVDETFAARTFFKKRIAHGMLSASLFSTLVGMFLPGFGAIYRSQQIEFVRPVYIGDTLTASFTVKSVDARREIVEMEGVIENQHGQVVVKGDATASLIRKLEDVPSDSAEKK